MNHTVPPCDRAAAIDTLTNLMQFKAKIGLVDRVYPVGHIPSDESTDWARLWNHVSALNEEAKDGAKYKLFFLLRAGESWHNVGELKYGMDSWEVS